MKLSLSFSCLIICLAFAPAAGAAPFAVNCAAYTPSTAVNINQPADDVTIDCALNVNTLIIRAHSITVGSTGSIRTSGKAGMKLLAGLDSNGNLCTDPSPLSATITINGAPLEDDNNNGGVWLKSCWDIDFNTGSSAASAGANVHAECV